MIVSVQAVASYAASLSAAHGQQQAQLLASMREGGGALPGKVRPHCSPSAPQCLQGPSPPYQSSRHGCGRTHLHILCSRTWVCLPLCAGHAMQRVLRTMGLASLLYPGRITERCLRECSRFQERCLLTASFSEQAKAQPLGFTATQAERAARGVHITKCCRSGSCSKRRRGSALHRPGRPHGAACSGSGRLTRRRRRNSGWTSRRHAAAERRAGAAQFRSLSLISPQGRNVRVCRCKVRKRSKGVNSMGRGGRALLQRLANRLRNWPCWTYDHMFSCTHPDPKGQRAGRAWCQCTLCLVLVVALALGGCALSMACSEQILSLSLRWRTKPSGHTAPVR